MKVMFVDRRRRAFAAWPVAVTYNHRPGLGKFSMAGPVFPGRNAPGRGE